MKPKIKMGISRAAGACTTVLLIALAFLGSNFLNCFLHRWLKLVWVYIWDLADQGIGQLADPASRSRHRSEHVHRGGF